MSAVALAFVGDVCLGGGMRTALVRNGPAKCFELVQPLIADRDLVCGNLEFCLVQDSVRQLPKNVMQVPRAFATGLEHSGIGVWNLSNNHIMDGGTDGLATTVRFLDDRGMRYFGAGANLADAERTVVVDVRGAKVGFIGACDVPRYFASPTEAGVAPMLARRLVRRVADARKQLDLVICILHADLEFSRYPAPARVRLARALIEQGADLVIQHHPHVCQGVERYGRGLIAYSLGNFVFPVVGDDYQERFPDTKWSVVLSVDIEWRGNEKTITWRSEPVTLGVDSLPAPSTGDARDDQLAILAAVSERLNDRALLRREWWRRCLQEARSTYYVLHHRRRRTGLRSALSEAIGIVRDPYERRWIYGLLTAGAAG